MVLSPSYILYPREDPPPFTYCRLLWGWNGERRSKRERREKVREAFVPSPTGALRTYAGKHLQCSFGAGGIKEINYPATHTRVLQPISTRSTQPSPFSALPHYGGSTEHSRPLSRRPSFLECHPLRLTYLFYTAHTLYDHSPAPGWNSLSSRSPNVEPPFRPYALSIESRRYWIVQRVYFHERLCVSVLIQSWFTRITRPAPSYFSFKWLTKNIILLYILYSLPGVNKYTQTKYIFFFDSITSLNVTAYVSQALWHTRDWHPFYQIAYLKPNLSWQYMVLVKLKMVVASPSRDRLGIKWIANGRRTVRSRSEREETMVMV